MKLLTLALVMRLRAGAVAFAAGLLAYRRPLYQLLALPRRGEALRPSTRCGEVRSVGHPAGRQVVPTWINTLPGPAERLVDLG